MKREQAFGIAVILGGVIGAILFNVIISVVV
jgi:hypothetical protein